MKAMLLRKISSLKETREPLDLADISIPEPEKEELLIKVSVCGVCHTELDEIEGRTPPPEFPVVPGHQVVGTVVNARPNDSIFKEGDRVGVAWIYSACGKCKFCMSGRENLCESFLATGRDRNGGYAEYMTANRKFVFPIPESFKDAEAAPLLCAGAIGYRSVALTGLKNGEILGLTGFGVSAHLVLKLVKFQYPDSKIYVYARSEKDRQFARELGADWVGDTAERSPERPSCIIDTTPAWKPVVEAMANLEKGGRLVINAIRKEEFDKEYLQTLSYQRHLWMEKEIKSVANVTSRDVRKFMELAATAGIRPTYTEYPLEKANEAIREMREQKKPGARVLRVC